MGIASATARRGLFGVFAVAAGGGVATAIVIAGLAVPGGLAAPSATAAPDPCAASEVAKTVGSVATSTGKYLDTHPETNTALTTISKQQAGPQSLVALKTYFDANPKAGKDIQQLQQPLVGLSARCDLPLTLPQVMGLMQGVQSQADALQSPAAGSLPAGLPSAQTVGTPGAGSAVSQPPASVGRQGAGPLPGPASVSTR
jgi:hemophore